jgi:hypothetical protein
VSPHPSSPFLRASSRYMLMARSRSASAGRDLSDEVVFFEGLASFPQR